MESFPSSFVPIHTVHPYHSPIKVVVSPRHQPSMPSWIALSERLSEYALSYCGSALKICLVARGEADLYPQLGPTSEWDTAAGQCLLEEAGGLLVDLSGKPLRYNTHATLNNPGFYAMSDVALRPLCCG